MDRALKFIWTWFVFHQLCQRRLCDWCVEIVRWTHLCWLWRLSRAPWPPRPPPHFLESHRAKSNLRNDTKLFMKPFCRPPHLHHEPGVPGKLLLLLLNDIITQKGFNIYSTLPVARSLALWLTTPCFISSAGFSVSMRTSLSNVHIFGTRQQQ